MIRIIVSENEPGDADGLIGALGDVRGLEVVGIARDGLECAMLAAQLRPDIALVRTQMAAMDGYRAAQLTALTSPDTQCVLVVDHPGAEAAALPQAMRAGARAVTHLAADPALLVRMLQALVEARPARQDDDYLLVSDPERLPFTISVTGSKGGIGKTTTATNLALAMQQRFPGQVVLVDFVGHYGDISLMLNLAPEHGILDLADHAELDGTIIGSMIVKHSSGLHVMAGVNSEDTLHATGRLSMGHVANLLGELRRVYRVIIIDTPALAYPMSQYIYQRSSIICLLTCLAELTTVRSTASLLQSLLLQRIPPERIKLVVSRYDPQDDYTLAQLKDSLHHPVAAKIPLGKDVAISALNLGVPYVLGKPNSPQAAAVNELADLFVSEIKAAATAAP